MTTRDLWDRVIAEDEMDGPRAWIQWKGTQACMDVHCSCGYHGHVHGDFAYFYHCRCGKVWSVGQNVRLHALTDDEAKEVLKEGLCIVTDDEGGA